MANKTLGTSGRDYSTWSAMAAALNALTLTTPYSVDCYNDSSAELVEATNGAGNLGGWSGGSSTNTMTIAAATGQGLWNNPNVLTNALNYDGTLGFAVRWSQSNYTTPLVVSSTDVFFTGLQLKWDSANCNNGSLSVTAARFTYDKCVFVGNGSNSASRVVLWPTSSASVGTNCLLIQRNSSGLSNCIQWTGSTGHTITDLTMIGKGTSGSALVINYATVVVKNCVAYGFPTSFDKSGHDAASGSTNNATDSSFSGTNAGHLGQTGVSSSDFTGASDYRVPSSSPKLANGATAGPTTDFSGASRSGTYTIGCWQISSGGGGGGGGANSVAVAHASSPFVTTYPWAAGFGTKYSNPATLPAGTGYGVAFGGGCVAVAHGTSPFITAWPWNNPGFGTKFADPGTLPSGAGKAVVLDANTIAVGQSTSPYVSVYPFAYGFGTRFTAPAGVTSSTVGASFNPQGLTDLALAWGLVAGSIYPFTVGVGAGSAYSNPASPPNDNIRRTNWSPSAADIAMAFDSASGFGIAAYPWSAGFGTRYSDPASVHNGYGTDATWSPSGADIVCSLNNLPNNGVCAYPWSAGFGTKYTDPAVAPAGGPKQVVWTSTGEVMMPSSGSPFITAWPWSAGFGTKYSNPGNLPAGTGYSAAFFNGPTNTSGSQTPRDFPNPVLPRRAVSLLTFVAPNTVLGGTPPGTPFYETDYPNPVQVFRASTLRSFVNALSLELLSQDSFFGAPGQGPTYRYPNPPGARYPRDLFTFVDAGLSLDISLLPKPFNQNDWPNPRGAQYSIALRNFVDPLKLTLLSQDHFFGGPGQGPVYDYPNPKVKEIPIALRGFSSAGLALFTLGSKPNTASWDQPRVTPYNLELRTFTSSGLALYASASMPLNQTDFPNPRSPQALIELRNFTAPLTLNLLSQDQFFGGPGQGPNYDYPNPRGPRLPLSLRNFTQTALGIPTLPVPFAQYDYPNPPGARYATALRGFNTNPEPVPLFGQDSIYGAPGQAPTYNIENPLPRIYGGGQYGIAVNLVVTTLFASAVDPIKQNAWQNPLLVRYAVSLKTWTQPLNVNLRGQDRFFGVGGPEYDYPNPRSKAPASTLRNFTHSSPIQLLGHDTFPVGNGGRFYSPNPYARPNFDYSEPTPNPSLLSYVAPPGNNPSYFSIAPQWRYFIIGKSTVIEN